MVFAPRLRPRRRQRGRQPDPPELRDRDGRRRPRRQRGRAQQRPRSTRPRIVGPAGAGVLIATARRRALLPDQRRHLRGDDRRPAGHGPAAARLAPCSDAERRGGVGAAIRYVRGEPALLIPLAMMAAGRHAGLQLPGPAAAARPLHLRRRRRRLHRARGRDGGRLGRRRARRPAPAAGSSERLLVGASAALRRLRAARRRRADAAARDGRPGPARRGRASPSPPGSTRPSSSRRARRCAAG